MIDIRRVKELFDEIAPEERAGDLAAHAERIEDFDRHNERALADAKRVS